MALDFQSMTMDDYLGLLSRRKKRILILFLSFLVIGVMILFFLPKMYTAKTLVKVKGWGPTGDIHQNLPAAPFIARLDTINEDMRGREKMFENIDQLNMAGHLRTSSEREEFRKTVDDHLSIKLGTGAERTIELEFEWFSPRLAALFVKSLMDSYISSNQDEYRGKVLEAKDKLLEQKSKMEGEFRKRQSEKVRFEEENQDVLAGEVPRYVKLLEDTITSLETKRKERTSLQKKFLVRKQQLTGTPETVKKITEIANKRRAQLLTELAEVDKHLAKLREKFTEEWPPVKHALLRKEALLARIEELPKMEESEQISEQNPLYTALTEQIQELESNLAALEEEIPRLVQDNERYEGLIRDIPHKKNTLMHLQAEINAREEKLNEKRQECAEAQFAWDKVREASLTLYEVLDEAVPPTAPSSPDMVFGMVVSLVVSLGLALALVVSVELFSRSISTIEEAKRFLAIPVLGAIDVLIGEAEKRRMKRRKVVLVASSVTVIVLGMALLFVYVRYPQYLPPFLRNVLTDIKEVIIQPEA